MRYNHYTDEEPDRRARYRWAAVLVTLALIGIVTRCDYLDEPIEPLTREQRAEVMSRQTAFDREQNVDMADRVMAAKVEREWREGR